jgi:DNA-binding NarL/FixJ family response regulator
VALRLAVAEDSLLVREGLRSLLRGAGFELVGEAETVDELLEVVERERPDAVLVDIRLPPTFTDEGLRAAGEIRARFDDVALVVLSQYVEAEYALRLLDGNEDGVGYLLKDRILDVSQLSEAIARVVDGGVVIDPELVSFLLDRRRRADPLDELTVREREVLALMAEGLTDRGIAERLYLTPNTVETHIRHVIAKLGLPATPADNRRVHAVLVYLRSG